jgi:hypothetical protein
MNTICPVNGPHPVGYHVAKPGQDSALAGYAPPDDHSLLADKAVDLNPSFQALRGLPTARRWTFIRQQHLRQLRGY